MNIFDYLNLRTGYESIVQAGKKFDLPSLNGDIDNLYYYVNEGYVRNRFRRNSKKALTIAESIVESYENEKVNLSSVHRQA